MGILSGRAFCLIAVVHAFALALDRGSYRAPGL